MAKKKNKRNSDRANTKAKAANSVMTDEQSTVEMDEQAADEEELITEEPEVQADEDVPEDAEGEWQDPDETDEEAEEWLTGDEDEAEEAEESEEWFADDDDDETFYEEDEYEDEEDDEEDDDEDSDGYEDDYEINSAMKLKELEADVEELRESVEALMEKAELNREAEEETDTEEYVEEEEEAPVRPKKMKRSKRRSAEIFGVFAKHNFYANGITPEELRTTLEDLGPTYVKIGQIMSSRVDLLPESYCKELQKLRQNVQELDPQLARAVIEEQTGRKIEDIYSEFRDKPLGSASVGQAHLAVLRDGRCVVTKVRRPYIADMMRQDFVLLKKLARGFNVVSENADNAEEKLDLIEVIEEFEKVTEEELDFRTEARNTQFFKENCIVDEDKVTCPDVIEELTTESMFTMSFVDGYSISNKDRVIEDGYDVEEIGRELVENYVHQILDVGTFHADPHQGNIMISQGKPVWIDFGMLGRITDGDINIIQSLVLAVLEKDVETIANSIMSMGASTSLTNRDRLIEDLDIFMDRYCSVTSISDLDVSVLFDEICNLAAKHHVKMPGKFTMLVRSLGTFEGVIEEFCPELNLFNILSSRMMDRAKKSFDLEQELASVGKDVLEIGKKTAKIPALASDVLKSVARGRTKINLELTGYEELTNKAGDSIRNVVLSFIACIVFFGSCILCTADLYPKAPGGMPAIAVVGLVFSIALAIHAVKNLSK